MADESNRVLKALHDLVASCNDAAEGYGKAAKGIHDSALSNQLAEISNERERFAVDLTSTIRELGGEARNDLHEGGILHRGWVDLEQALRPKDDLEILQECVTGDAGTVKHYDHALAQELPDEVRSLVEEQKLRVEQDIAYLRARTPKRKSQQA
jgi:uncharacterized protein (TIGR02284 family)